MPGPLCDTAWRLIVNAAGARGTRGKTFLMSRSTYRALCVERGVASLPTLYSVAVTFSTELRHGEIRLEKR